MFSIKEELNKFIKPPIEDAIEQCFLETESKYLELADIKFLLHKEELKRYSTKQKKRLYIKWENKLKDPFHNTWKHPFNIYNCKSFKSFLYKKLNEMVKKNRLLKDGNGYSLIGSVNNYFKARDKMNIDYYSPDFMAMFGDNKPDLIMYGFLQYFKIVGKNYNKNILKKLKNEMTGIVEKINNLHENLQSMNLLQLEFLLNLILKEIALSNFKDKDKKLAYKFLKSRFTLIEFINRVTTNNIQDIEIDIKKKYAEFELVKLKGMIQLKYMPEKYYIKDKVLCQYLINYLVLCSSFFEPKPVVFTPRLDKNSINKVYNIQESLLSKY